MRPELPPVTVDGEPLPDEPEGFWEPIHEEVQRWVEDDE